MNTTRINNAREALNPKHGYTDVEEGEDYEVLETAEHGFPVKVRWADGTVDNFTNLTASLSNRAKTALVA